MYVIRLKKYNKICDIYIYFILSFKFYIFGLIWKLLNLYNSYKIYIFWVNFNINIIISYLFLCFILFYVLFYFLFYFILIYYFYNNEINTYLYFYYKFVYSVYFNGFVNFCYNGMFYLIWEFFRKVKYIVVLFSLYLII